MEGSKEQMSAVQTFFAEHIDTPTGQMCIVTDDAQRLRSVDGMTTKRACWSCCFATTAGTR